MSARAEAERQLALRHLLLLDDLARRARGLRGDAGLRLVERAISPLHERRRGKQGFHRVGRERTAVEQLDLRLVQRAPVGGIQLVFRDFARLFDRAERGLAVGLVFAHQLGQAFGRPGARVVFLRRDAVDQALALARGVVRAEHAVLQIRVIQQVGEQADDLGSQPVRTRGIGLVDAVGQKADAQAFALLAHGGFDARAVQLVQRPADRAQVGQLCRAAAQHLRQAGAQRGVRPAEREQQPGAQHRPFELRRGHAGEVHPVAQLFPGHLLYRLHHFPRFRRVLHYSFYYSIIAGAKQTKIM